MSYRNNDDASQVAAAISILSARDARRNNEIIHRESGRESACENKKYSVTSRDNVSRRGARCFARSIIRISRVSPSRSGNCSRTSRAREREREREREGDRLEEIVCHLRCLSRATIFRVAQTLLLLAG